MLRVALEAAGIPNCRRASSWDDIGYWVGKDKELWAGITYDQPTVVKLVFEKVNPPKEFFEALERGEWREEKSRFGLELESEAVHFFARSKESQLELLTNFFRQAYADACSYLTKHGSVSDSDSPAPS